MAERELEKFQQQNCAVKLSMCKGAYNGNGSLDIAVTASHPLIKEVQVIS